VTTAIIVHPHAFLYSRPVWNESVERRRIQDRVVGVADGWYLAMEQLSTALGVSYAGHSDISAPPYVTLRNAALDATWWGNTDEPGYLIACEYALRHSREARTSWRRHS